MSIVARLAREVPGQVWQRYDRLLRQAAAVNSALAWDRREMDIWLAATVEHPRPIQSSSGGSIPLKCKTTVANYSFFDATYQVAAGS